MRFQNNIHDSEGKAYSHPELPLAQMAPRQAEPPTPIATEKTSVRLARKGFVANLLQIIIALLGILFFRVAVFLRALSIRVTAQV
jgi:hypothetical protein